MAYRQSLMDDGDEFENEMFAYYDEFPEEDPFEDANIDLFDSRDQDSDDEFELTLAYKDDVAERLLDAVDEYLTFASKWELIKLLANNL